MKAGGIFSVVCLLLLFLSVSASEAQAQNAPSYDVQMQTSQCLATPPVGSGIQPADWKQKFSARMIYCMQKLIRESTHVFTRRMVDEFAMPTLGAVMAFAMTIFGMKVLGGMFRNVKSESFLFLVKVGFIVGIMAGIEHIVDFWFDMIDMLIEIVTNARVFLGTGLCPVSANNLGGGFGVWDRFDCLFGKLIGFGANTAMATGLVGLVGAAISTGGLGIWLALVAIAGIYAVAQFLFRALMMVLLSYGGMGLLLVVFPLFLPLLLFKKTEKMLMDKWLTQATGYVIQPALTLLLLLFSLQVMDHLMMKGSAHTYIQYYSTTNTTSVTTVKPGQTPPSGSEKAMSAISDILGFDPYSTVKEQIEAMKKVYRNLRQGKLNRLQSDSRAAGYVPNHDCGSAGVQTPSENIPVSKLKEDIWKDCTDPAKCKAAAAAGFPQAPSRATAVGVNQFFCNYSKTNNALLAKGTPGQGAGAIPNSSSSVELDFVGRTANNNNNAAVNIPDNINNKSIMQLVGSIGGILLFSGVMFTFMTTIPQMVQGLAGAPGQKLSLVSPTVGGKSLAERFKSGMNNAVHSHKQAIADGMGGKYRMFRRMRGEGLKGFGNRMGGAALMGFAKGFMSPKSAETKNYSVRQLTGFNAQKMARAGLAAANKKTRGKQSKQSQEGESKEPLDKKKIAEQLAEDQKYKDMGFEGGKAEFDWFVKHNTPAGGSKGKEDGGSDGGDDRGGGGGTPPAPKPVTPPGTAKTRDAEGGRVMTEEEKKDLLRREKRSELEKEFERTVPHLSYYQPIRKGYEELKEKHKHLSQELNQYQKMMNRRYEEYEAGKISKEQYDGYLNKYLSQSAPLIEEEKLLSKDLQNKESALEKLEVERTDYKKVWIHDRLKDFY